MRKKLRLMAITVIANLFALSAICQNTTIKGSVRNASNNEKVPAVSVTIKGSDEGTYTDDRGNFIISTNQRPPLTLLFTSISFESQEVRVTNASQVIDVDFKVASGLGQEVVVSATRTPTRILESPVSIDRISAANIRNTAASNYYDMVANLKGVDVIASSLTFKTPTTRGFSGSGNTRFNQIMNGMDNQAPGLNFSVGSVIGLTELDVESVEVLQGASSALYGPGGMLGTMLVNGKNPFKYQGLSFQVKTGFMHAGDKLQGTTSPYYNWNVRWAQQVNKKLAFKIGAELIQAKDWQGDDYRNYKRFGTKGSLVDGTRETDPNYDGVNVYGDETSVNLRDVLNGIGAAAPFLQGYIATLPGSIPVSRTGYTEREVVNPNTVNLKLSGAIHYKITDKIEANITGYFGTGNTVYTGSQRYSLKDLKVGQYKFELNHKNWFFRAYTTQENSGEAHNLTVATQLFNEAWKPSTTWYPIYGQTYLAAKLGGATDLAAHTAARAAADVGRPAAGSDQFKSTFEAVRKKPIPFGGLFLDRSDLYMIEGQYNLTDAVKFAEVLVGGNWKEYVLNSQGTLFPDKPGAPITIKEYGAYVQISKALLEDKIKLTASGRYDKNENFDGRFTPRLGIVFKPAKDHNIRLSFQTAYRFPSTQQQWIDLPTGSGNYILGCNKFVWDKHNLTANPAYAAESVAAGSPVVLSYINAKPESVTSYELGYKALIAKKFLLDVYGYYGQYENFLSRRDAIQKIDPNGPVSDLSNTTKRVGVSIVVNAPGKVTTYGWGASVEYLLPANFSITGNVSSDVLKDVPAGFQAGFNTPKYRTNLIVANSGFGPKKLFGASLAWKWQDKFNYESDFIFGEVPAYHNVDFQVNYRFPEIKSMVKLGATNLLNQYYRTGLGNSSIGGLYYLSFGYNIF
ncbi:MAG: TonB-dependent receptor [Chitinophagaceae bacterium]